MLSSGLDDGSRLLSTSLFGQLDASFRELLDEPDAVCGGLPIILMGDNFQMDLGRELLHSVAVVQASGKTNRRPPWRRLSPLASASSSARLPEDITTLLGADASSEIRRALPLVHYLRNWPKEGHRL